MKQSQSFISSILTAAALFSSCGQDNHPSKVDAAESTSQGESSLETQTKQAVSSAESATKDAVQEAKQEWKKLTEPKVVDLDKSIADLKRKAEEASGDARIELDKLVQEVGKERKALQQEFTELKAASAEKWQAASQTIDQKLSDLKKSIDSALEKSK
jgi:hypothetical protein